MVYDLSKLPLSSLLRPISDAASALSRLDERIARSPVGEGFVERSQFTDACASLWIDGELVHLEDLVRIIEDGSVFVIRIRHGHEDWAGDSF